MARKRKRVVFRVLPKSGHWRVGTCRQRRRTRPAVFTGGRALR